MNLKIIQETRNEPIDWLMKGEKLTQSIVYYEYMWRARMRNWAKYLKFNAFDVVTSVGRGLHKQKKSWIWSLVIHKLSVGEYPIKISI